MSAKRRLAAARKRRHRIALAFDRLEKGQLFIEDVLEDPTHVLGNVDIWDLLRRAHNMGEAGSRKVLEKAHVWPHTRVRALSEEDKHRIVQCLPPRARRRDRAA
jgi:hypothetical protein